MSIQLGQVQDRVGANAHKSNLSVIAYLLNSFPCLSETFIMQEILELERQGLPLRLFALAESSDRSKVDSVKEVRAATTYLSHYSVKTLAVAATRRFVRAPWRFLRAGITTLAHYKRRTVFRYLLYAAFLADQLEHEGILHVHAHYASDAASIAQTIHLLAGISYSFTAHAYDIYLSPKKELAYKIQMASFVVTCTAYNLRYLESIVDQSLYRRINCIYHGLNLAKFPVHHAADSVPCASPLILSVARLLEKKGLSYLLQACRLLKDRGYDFRCRIVGEGPLRQALEQEIRDLSIADKVEMWGAATHKQVIEMYQHAAIVTLPCVVDKNGDRDGIPNVLVEALCMEVPVVSTPVSGIPELITSEVNGLLVAPEDSVALANALARLLDDSSLRSHLAVAGRQKVLEQFDAESNTLLLLHLLKTV